MKCPHCSKDIAEHLIISEAARIQGRRSKRTLSSDEARKMAFRMHDLHAKPRKGKGEDK
jgi:hypothetical protein